MTTATIKHTKDQAGAALAVLQQFINPDQFTVLRGLMRGEERQFFFDKACELAAIIQGMPATYETDGRGDKSIVWLHYFAGGCASWWITEKDADTDGQGQHQAFGLADVLGRGQGAEIGYISIVELLQNRAELDFYWTPKPLAEVRKELEA